MLKEIKSEAFKSNGIIRPTIVFHNGLNVINGSDSGTNSIGKSTFLMIIDFCFGGDDYIEKLKTVIKNVGEHEIYFAFEFNNVMYHFCRSTADSDIICLCNEQYDKTNEKWSKNEFIKWLNTNYSNPTSLTFRAMVSLYFRIYNRENLNESLPLRNFDNQTEAQSIETLLKLFDLFSPIANSSKEAKEANEQKDAFIGAQKYNFIPKITEKKYKDNLKRIGELEQQKIELADKSEKGLLDLTSSQAEEISKLRSELSVYKRQRGKLYNQLEIIKKDKVDNKEFVSSDFEDLKEFFPDLSVEKLNEVESFHNDISKIMISQLNNSEKKTWNLINLLNETIKNLELKITNISNVKHVSKVTLDKYSEIDGEIAKLKLENEKFILLKDLKDDTTQKEKKLSEDTMVQSAILDSKINSKMTELNTLIFGENVNTPEFHIKSPKSYEFYTPNDDGTGTKYKGLIIMDIATLLLTSLPVLIHDSVLLKQISNESIEKIFNIYSSSPKQIFISIDKETSYTQETARLINSSEVLKLSSGGNELFGFAFGMKKKEETTND